jgi:hypothetical protein
MMRMEHIEATLCSMAKEASDDWFRKQTRNEFASLYLYFKRSTETEWGSLAIAEKTPEGYQLADPQRLYPGWSRTQVKNHIRGILQHLPILPYGS